MLSAALNSRHEARPAGFSMAAPGRCPVWDSQSGPSWFQFAQHCKWYHSTWKSRALLTELVMEVWALHKLCRVPFARSQMHQLSWVKSPLVPPFAAFVVRRSVGRAELCEEGPSSREVM